MSMAGQLPDFRTPAFRTPAFLVGHVAHTLAFYEGRALDPSGGFFHFFKDDGTVYDRRTRHLVSSTRFVFNHAMAYRRFGRVADQDAARHGLRFLHTAHAQPQGGFAWEIDWDGERATVRDGTNHCYGLAFVLLAQAHALRAGHAQGRGDGGNLLRLHRVQFMIAAQDQRHHATIAAVHQQVAVAGGCIDLAPKSGEPEFPSPGGIGGPEARVLAHQKDPLALAGVGQGCRQGRYVDRPGLQVGQIHKGCTAGECVKHVTQALDELGARRQLGRRHPHGHDAGPGGLACAL